MRTRTGTVVDDASDHSDCAGNVSFSIPSNLAADKFSVTPNGLVTLRGPLNRELVSRYSVPILARSSKLLDISTLEVLVMDENDNSPEFRPGSCYTLAVPENQGTSVIHTIAAADLDEGKNGEIYYSIVGKDPLTFRATSTFAHTQVELGSDRLLCNRNY